MAKGKSVAISETAPIKTGPSLIVQLGALLMVTAVAVGTGWLSGNYLNGESAGTASTGEKAAPSKVMPAHREVEEKREEGHGAEPASPTVIPLAGITTNLAAPSDVWIRMEASIVLDEPQDAGLPELVHQDFLAFVRTLKLHQIEGASGFQHFKADLEERAAIRSGGHVKQVLIRTLLFE
jgi:flagellar FliL protein